MTDPWGPQAPQQYAPPQQQQWGPPVQQLPYGGGAVPPQPYSNVAPQPPKPAVATPSIEEIMGGTRSGDWAPGFWFAGIGSGIIGVVGEQEVIPKTDRVTGAQRTAQKSGAPLWQVRVLLETSLRGWAGVKKLPMQQDGVTPQDPSEDDGKRAVYLWFTLRDAVTDAIVASGSGHTVLVKGWALGIRAVGTQSNQSGQSDSTTFKAYYAPTVDQVKELALADMQSGVTPPPYVPPQQQYAPQPQQQQVQQAPQQPQPPQQPQYAPQQQNVEPPF